MARYLGNDTITIPKLNVPTVDKLTGDLFGFVVILALDNLGRSIKVTVRLHEVDAIMRHDRNNSENTSPLQSLDCHYSPVLRN